MRNWEYYELVWDRRKGRQRDKAMKVLYPFAAFELLEKI